VSAPRYLWDNWACRRKADGLIHRFALTAPRSLRPEERHAHAEIHRWTSADGADWTPHGPVLARRPAWSGCATDLGARMALFFTGVEPEPERRQTIRAAFSTDGETFTEHPAPLLEPSTQHGYDTGDADGVIMAWRDPFVFRDQSGAWRMLFSAKNEGSCVGQAAAEDDSLTRWKLLPPLDLPARYPQMELPGVMHAKDAVYCLVSTTDAVRAYRAATLDGPWEPAGEEGDLVLNRDTGIYAATLLAGENLAMGFHTADYSWTRLLPLRIEGQRLRLTV